MIHIRRAYSMPHALPVLSLSKDALCARLATSHRYIPLEGACAHGGAVNTVPGVSGAAL